MTNGHKNHIRLLEAVALLRERGPRRPRRLLRQTGARLAGDSSSGGASCELEEQVRFTGFIAPEELLALYRLAQFVVFPSLFEGAGLPVLEAMEQGVPIACSEIPPLREYAGDTALFFDPTRVEDIADAIARLSSDPTLRHELREAALRRVEQFSPRQMARRHLAVYRRAIEKGNQ